MKVAYLVVAHNNARVLQGAIKTLDCQDCAFFIHIDKKSDIGKFSHIRGQNIHFSKTRLPIYWGEYSMVQATLNLIRQAFTSDQKYDYLVLTSGSHYPLKSGRYILDFFAANHEQEFITIATVPSHGKPLSRINTLRFQSDKPVRRLAVRALAKVGLAQRDYRKHLGNLRPYAGNTWWALTRGACQYILKFVDENQAAVKFFQNMFVPDESFFHTIMGNSSFRSRIRRNLLYEDWSRQGAHPETIRESHVQFFEETDVVFDDLGESELLFARKFSDEDPQLLRRMDAMIARKAALPAHFATRS